ncbi:MAG: hypothetical protein IJO56_06110 [Oscillospiraceae bacterium]|nr:hypothetical protein [Oscillospiraceae bacterium]
MSGKYDDIMDLPYPLPTDRPRMSMHDRAAQFAPFAALTGYDAAIREEGRLTDRKIELDESEMYFLDIKQQLLSEAMKEKPSVLITYYVPDDRKAGGKYVSTSGQLKKLDVTGRKCILHDGTVIPVDNILSMESPLFEALD